MARVLIFCVALLTFVACGSNDQKATTTAPAATTCNSGDTLCVGNVAVMCLNGTSWQVTACGKDKYCKAGACVAAACEKGSTSCAAGKDIKTCPSSGASAPVKSKTCTDDEVCQKGVCVVSPCKSGDKVCGWRSVLSCNDQGQWSATACAPDEICDAAKCVKRTCEPDAIQCKSAGVSQVCSATGDKWQDKTCASGEACQSGVCLPVLKGSEVADAGSSGSDAGSTGSDNGPIAGSDSKGFKDLGGSDIQLEANDVFTVVMSDTAKAGSDAAVTSFDTVFASYLPGSDLQMLQIDASLGGKKIEIQVAPIELFTTGDFNPTGDASNTKVLYDDENAQSHDPQNWQWQSASYVVHIDQWDDPAQVSGARVKGTFSAEMGNTQDKPGAKMFLVNGKFDVAFK